MVPSFRVVISLSVFKEKFLDFGWFGYVSYFQIGNFFGATCCIGPSTWGRSKRSWSRSSLQHYYSVNNNPPPKWIKLAYLPFNIHLIGMEFGKTKLPFAFEIYWTEK